jgi:hypothetical protein
MYTNNKIDVFLEQLDFEISKSEVSSKRTFKELVNYGNTIVENMYNDALSNAYSLLENANNILYQEKSYRSSSYSGYRSLFEEDEKKDEKEGFFKRSYDSVKNGVNSVIDFIKKYTMQFYNWVKSIVEAIVDRVKKLLGMSKKEEVSEEWKKEVKGKDTYTSADMEKPVEKIYEKINSLADNLEKDTKNLNTFDKSKTVLNIEPEKKEIALLANKETATYEENLKLFSYLTKKNKELSYLVNNMSTKVISNLEQEESNKDSEESDKNKASSNVQGAFLSIINYSKSLVSTLAGTLEKSSNKYLKIIKKVSLKK